MSKIKFNEINQKDKKEILNNLLFILSTAKNKDDLILFILGGLTGQEIITFSNRLNIAKEIIEGKSYRKIQNNLDVGSTTIKTVVNLLSKNNNSLEKVLRKYFNEKDGDLGIEDFKFQKNKLYNYPGYALAAKLLGIEYLDKKIQGK